MVRPDVFVIGGGPAGLATAIAARQKGFTVAVVEASQPPIDKACGEGLMPDGVEALKQLGVRLGPAESAPFRGIQFIDDGTSARAEFPSSYGLGVRRTTLHAMLAERAADIGVQLHWNTCLRELDTRCARWIVGADGRNSRVRRCAGFDESHASEQRFGFRRHIAVAPWSDTVEVHWGEVGQIYITPVNGNEVCLALVSRHAQPRLDEAVQGFPEIARRVRGLLRSTRERGSITECRRLRSVVLGNVLLVGDASGTVDAVTGEGLALSFQQALALAEAIASNDPRSYETAHRRIVGMPALMGRLMLLMDRRPWLRQRVIRALAANPELFSKMLAMHTGSLAAREFGLGGLLGFAGQLIVPGRRAIQSMEGL